MISKPTLHSFCGLNIYGGQKNKSNTLTTQCNANLITLLWNQTVHLGRNTHWHFISHAVVQTRQTTGRNYWQLARQHQLKPTTNTSGSGSAGWQIIVRYVASVSVASKAWRRNQETCWVAVGGQQTSSRATTSTFQSPARWPPAGQKCACVCSNGQKPTLWG